MTLNLPFLMEFVVYLTNRCNLRCEMCSQYGENFKEKACPDLPVYEWKKFFDTISDVNPKPKIILMGGEPFLYKDIDEVINYLNQNNFGIQIVTNGVLLDKHMDTISKCNNITITFSIDGLEKTHDKIRGISGTYAKAIDNIRKLSELKQKKQNILTYINSVLLPDNIDEVEEFLETIQKEDINQVVFQHLQFATENLNKISKEEWKKYLGKPYNGCFTTKKTYEINTEYTTKLKNLIPQLSKICGVETFIFPFLQNEEIDNYYFEKDLRKIRHYQRCTIPWLTAFIGANGDISNCIENKIGNITKGNFWDIWNNEDANRMRNSLCKNGNFTICAKCCNFYKNRFLYAPNGKIQIKGKEYILPNELSYLRQSKNGVLILDKTQSTEQELFAYPLEIYNDEMLKEIEKNETVICKFSDL